MRLVMEVREQIVVMARQVIGYSISSSSYVNSIEGCIRVHGCR